MQRIQIELQIDLRHSLPPSYMKISGSGPSFHDCSRPDVTWGLTDFLCENKGERHHAGMQILEKVFTAEIKLFTWTCTKWILESR